ncbi:MAG: 4-hydroxy-tetrahydrodipicolinate reductase [Candidatus Omnitrophica bacterium]|nr:4-hydroxy-tetrahydrodipicolinate reductase [Candidatus Omnitrophota bacterium]
MLKLAVSGACGRMGSRIIALAKNDKELSVAVCLERKGHAKLASQIEGMSITDDYSLVSGVDCVIEFTEPEATLKNLETCLKYKRPMVIGTTGLKQESIAVINKAAGTIPIVLSVNMSVGVNLVFKVVKELANVLSDYEIKIIEAHHIHKKDAPSGTAKKIAQIIKEARGKAAEDIQSIREDEIVGDHEIIFDGQFDRVSLKHSAKSRDIFAQGALIAAKWVVSKECGLYTMADCLSANEE